MERCITCKSELADTTKACPICGSSAGLDTGTIATVAMAVPPAPASNGSKAAVSRTSVSRMMETSIPDEGRFPPGTLVNGRYRIVGLLGRGGMGEVYRATDLTLAQAVALKFLPEAGVSERVLERFHAEVRIARQISHPNICRVYDIGEVDGQPFISMEYVDGEDLADLLQRIGRLPADKALDTARKICAGLAAAHDRGVIHRDLKPQNIMLNKRGEPVIMDFGLAAVADQLTGAEARNGTPAYMSPEQLRGDEVTAKSDIYALGLVLYEIFSGKRAYEAKTIGDLLKLQEGAQMTSLTSLAADVDPQVEKVIKRCLSPDPAMRPASPLAVSAALPGGDPLAAALAAGDTPSPELVAASGKTDGMDLRYSVPMLVFVVAAVITLAVMHARGAVLERTAVTYSPTVVSYQARQIAASFGYTQAPVDTFVGFTSGAPGREYWDKHDRKGKSWDELMAAEPLYQYFYRESPGWMNALPLGEVTPTVPSPTTAGMLDMTLAMNGKLRAFSAVPGEKVAAAATTMNEDALFRAIGYDPTGFTEVAPEVMPLHAFDTRKAWKGPAPGLPDVDVKVEAASLGGRLSAVKVIFPWTKASREPQPVERGAALVGPLGYIACVLAAILFALIFAVRNWRLNRADRKGAFRLALVIGSLVLLTWVGSAHHVPAFAEWNVLGNAASDAIFAGVCLWLLYLALEPAMRSSWPQAMVTWNRLLAGRFGDAQVGAHLLTGAAIGMLLRLFDGTLDWVDYRKTGAPLWNNLSGYEGPLAWISSHAQTMQGALSTGFIVFFTIFGFRALWKNDTMAAVSAAVLFTLIGNGGIWSDSSSNILVTRLLLLLIFLVLTTVLVRMGLTASGAAIFFINTSGHINGGPSLSEWYSPYGLATVSLMVGIAVYAFWRSIGARTIEDEEQG